MDLDFKSMKRTALQALCKKHGIPANTTNSVMADRLASLLLLQENDKAKPKPKGCLKGSGGSSGSGGEEPVEARVAPKKVSFTLQEENVHDLHGNPGGEKRRSSRRLSVGGRTEVAPWSPGLATVLDVPVRTRRSSLLPAAVVWSPVIENKRTRKGAEGVRRNAELKLDSELTGAEGDDAGEAEIKGSTVVPVTRSLRNRVVVAVGSEGLEAGGLEPRRGQKRRRLADGAGDAVAPDEMLVGEDDGGGEKKVGKKTSVEVPTTRSLRNRVVVVEGDGRLMEDVEQRKTHKRRKISNGAENEEAPLPGKSGEFEVTVKRPQLAEIIAHEESQKVLLVEAAPVRRSKRTLSKSGNSLQEGEKQGIDEDGFKDINWTSQSKSTSNKSACALKCNEKGSGAKKGKLLESDKLARRSTRSSRRDIPGENTRSSSCGVLADEEVSKKNKMGMQGSKLLSVKQVAEHSAFTFGAASNVTESKDEKIQDFVGPLRSSTGTTHNVFNTEKRLPKGDNSCVNNGAIKKKSAKQTGKLRLQEEGTKIPISKVEAVTTIAVHSGKEHPIRPRRSSRCNGLKDDVSIPICEDRVVNGTQVEQSKKGKRVRKIQSVTGGSNNFAPKSEAINTPGAVEVKEITQSFMQPEEALRQSSDNAQNHEAYPSTCLESGDDKADGGNKVRNRRTGRGLKRQKVQGKTGRQKRKLIGFKSVEVQSHLTEEGLTATSGIGEFGDPANIPLFSPHLPVVENEDSETGGKDAFGEKNISEIEQSMSVTELLADLDRGDNGMPLDGSHQVGQDVGLSSQINEELHNSLEMTDEARELSPLESVEGSYLEAYQLMAAKDLDKPNFSTGSCHIGEEILAASIVVNTSCESPGNEGFPTTQITNVPPETPPSSKVHECGETVMLLATGASTNIEDSPGLQHDSIDEVRACHVAKPAVFLAELSTGSSDVDSGVREDATNEKEKIVAAVIQSAIPENWTLDIPNDQDAGLSSQTNEELPHSLEMADEARELSPLESVEGSYLEAYQLMAAKDLDKPNFSNGSHHIGEEILAASIVVNTSCESPGNEGFPTTQIMNVPAETPSSKEHECGETVKLLATGASTNIEDSPNLQHDSIDEVRACHVAKPAVYLAELSTGISDVDSGVREDATNEKEKSVAPVIQSAIPENSNNQDVSLSSQPNEELPNSLEIADEAREFSPLESVQGSYLEAYQLMPVKNLDKPNFSNESCHIGQEILAASIVVNTSCETPGNEGFPTTHITNVLPETPSSKEHKCGETVKLWATGANTNIEDLPDLQHDSIDEVRACNVAKPAAFLAELATGSSDVDSGVRENATNEKEKIMDAVIQSVIPENLTLDIPNDQEKEHLDKESSNDADSGGLDVSIPESYSSQKDFNMHTSNEAVEPSPTIFIRGSEVPEYLDANVSFKLGQNGANLNNNDSYSYPFAGNMLEELVNVQEDGEHETDTEGYASTHAISEFVQNISILPDETTRKYSEILPTPWSSNVKNKAVGNNSILPIPSIACLDDNSEGLTLIDQSDTDVVMRTSTGVSVDISSPVSNIQTCRTAKKPREAFSPHLPEQLNVHGVGDTNYDTSYIEKNDAANPGLERGLQLGDVLDDGIENTDVCEVEAKSHEVGNESSTFKDILDGSQHGSLDTYLISDRSCGCVGGIHDPDITDNDRVSGGECKSSDTLKCITTVENFLVESSTEKTTPKSNNRIDTPPDTSDVQHLAIDSMLFSPAVATSSHDSKVRGLPLAHQSNLKDVMEISELFSVDFFSPWSNPESCQSTEKFKPAFDSHQLDGSHLPELTGQDHNAPSQEVSDLNGAVDSDVLPESTNESELVVNIEPERVKELGDVEKELCDASENISSEEFLVETNTEKTPPNCYKGLASSSESYVQQVAVDSNEFSAALAGGLVKSAEGLSSDQLSQSDSKDEIRNSGLLSVYPQSILQSFTKDEIGNSGLRSVYPQSFNSAEKHKATFGPHLSNEIQMNGLTDQCHIASSDKGTDVKYAELTGSKVIPGTANNAAFVVNTESERLELEDVVADDVENSDFCKIAVNDDYEGRTIKRKKASNLNRSSTSGMTDKVDTHVLHGTSTCGITENDHGAYSDQNILVNGAECTGFEVHPEIARNAAVEVNIESKSGGVLGVGVAGDMENIDVFESEINNVSDLEILGKEEKSNYKVKYIGIKGTESGSPLISHSNCEVSRVSQGAVITVNIDEVEEGYKNVFEDTTKESSISYDRSKCSNEEFLVVRNTDKAPPNSNKMRAIPPEIFYGEVSLANKGFLRSLTAGCLDGKTEGLPIEQKSDTKSVVGFSGSLSSEMFSPRSMMDLYQTEQKLKESTVEIHDPQLCCSAVCKSFLEETDSQPCKVGTHQCNENQMQGLADDDHLASDGSIDIDDAGFLYSEVLLETNHSFAAKIELAVKHGSGDGAADDIEKADVSEVRTVKLSDMGASTETEDSNLQRDCIQEVKDGVMTGTCTSEDDAIITEDMQLLVPLNMDNDVNSDDHDQDLRNKMSSDDFVNVCPDNRDKDHRGTSSDDSKYLPDTTISGLCNNSKLHRLLETPGKGEEPFHTNFIPDCVDYKCLKLSSPFEEEECRITLVDKVCEQKDGSYPLADFTNYSGKVTKEQEARFQVADAKSFVSSISTLGLQGAVVSAGFCTGKTSLCDSSSRILPSSDEKSLTPVEIPGVAELDAGNNVCSPIQTTSCLDENSERLSSEKERTNVLGTDRIFLGYSLNQQSNLEECEPGNKFNEISAEAHNFPRSASSLCKAFSEASAPQSCENVGLKTYASGLINCDTDFSYDGNSFNLNIFECNDGSDAEIASLGQKQDVNSRVLSETCNAFNFFERGDNLEDEVPEVNASRPVISEECGFNDSEVVHEENFLDYEGLYQEDTNSFHQHDQNDPLIPDSFGSLTDSSASSTKSRTLCGSVGESDELNGSDGQDQMEDINIKLTGFTISSAQKISKPDFQSKNKENTPNIKMDHSSRPNVERSSVSAVKRRPLQDLLSNSKV